MGNNEVIEMMTRCAEDIRALRRQIDCLKPKAEAYDAITIILGLIPRGGNVCVGEDVLWLLDRRIADLKATETKKKSKVDKDQPEADYE